MKTVELLLDSNFVQPQPARFCIQQCSWGCKTFLKLLFKLIQGTLILDSQLRQQILVELLVPKNNEKKI